MQPNIHDGTQTKRRAPSAHAHFDFFNPTTPIKRLVIERVVVHKRAAAPSIVRQPDVFSL